MSSINHSIEISSNLFWHRHQVKYKTYNTIASFKYNAAWIVANFDTLGKRVPIGEAEGYYHVYAPSRRRRAALAILDLIYGNGSRDGIRRLILSPSTYHMACSIVGNLGRSNISRALVALGTPIEQVKVPDSVIPLAAAAVSYRISQVAVYSCMAYVP